MKKAFRKSLKRQTSLGYFTGSMRAQSRTDSYSLRRMSTVTPKLWQTIAEKYQFNFPRDWYKIEAHWLDQIESFQEQPIDCPGRDGQMNNAITRISQCNESYQLCNSLPRSFIVPKDLKDFTLTNALSTIIKDHRVPIISYCCPIEYRRNFLIRCASSDQQERVVEILSKVVKPLTVINLDTLTPTLEYVEKAHRKLRDVCRPGDDQALNFLSKSGKWLSIVSATLKLATETARTLTTEASVILIEDDDRGWNSVISSLVQLLLEPHCRTINGLESLISKEWIYLSGSRPDNSKFNSLFVLFLDCIYQIYLQNVKKFEFTSEYLRYLFEAQFICMPSTTQSTHQENPSNISSQRTNGIAIKSRTASYTHDEDVIESETASYKPSMSMLDLNYSLNHNSNSYKPVSNSAEDDSSCVTKDRPISGKGYSSMMFNPFYEHDQDSPIIGVYSHIVNMKLWSSLYLGWLQPRVSYGCIEEVLYFEHSRQKIESVISPDRENDT